MKSLTNQTPPPIREVATKSIYTLKIQQNKLEQASFRLKERDRILFETCMGALKKNNKEKAAMCATEIAEVRKLVKFLYNVQLAIERVVLRLETIKELGDIVADLKPALKLLQGVSQELFQVLPDVSSELNNVNRQSGYAPRHQTHGRRELLIPVGKKTEAGEEILKEVSCFMEQKLAETLPEPPAWLRPVKEKTPIKELVALTASSSQVFGTENHWRKLGLTLRRLCSLTRNQRLKSSRLKLRSHSLEDVLLEYVRKTNGEIDLGRCSSELQHFQRRN